MASLWSPAYVAIGSNLNQLARTANTGEIVDQRELSESIAELRPVRDAIMSALGRAQ